MATENTGNNPIIFVVPGQPKASRGGAALQMPAAIPGLGGQVKAAVRVSSRRDSGEAVRVSAVPGEDVVLLEIAGGPTLLLHPESARDLMLGCSGSTRSAGVDQGEIAVPAQLRWRGLEQAAPTRGGGFLGHVLLQAFEVITGIVQDKAVDFAAAKVVAKLDGQVDAGVYALQRESLAALKGSPHRLAQVPSAVNPASEPLLVLVHGTFVDTVSTFGKLWALHPQRVAELFAHYGGRVYALDHPTVGASPIANALTLAEALPAGARLHLLTHSRGGLVAEVLALVCGRIAAQRDIADTDLAFFADPQHAAHRRDLQRLASVVKAKGIAVDRVVRVACPARGTLLASKRLDAYLSVLKWGIELTGVPVLPALVEFLAEVARRRASPDELPGLAAMIPDSPLLNWLNGAEEAVAGELRVVAGDLQGDSVMGWLKTLLADAYYWTDNDIVVHTRSMYGGVPRQGGASFLLDQSGRSTHFAYFANERTAAAIVAALVQPQPAGFRTIGVLSWSGQDSSGLRAARRAATAASDAARPAVFVLPGILGSHLKADGKRIWLSLRLVGGLARLRYAPGVADGVQDDGPVGLIYDDLIEHLAATHEVIPFGFDWRRPIEEEAARLADAVDRALDARRTSGAPVRLLAHSMGGLVARTMELERPQTWARLMQHKDARLLMLGTPNGGSWAPMQVLSGDDSFGNTLAAFGSPLRDRQARQLMAEMPGFIQLQAALLDPARGLARTETWRRIADDDLKRVQDNNWWHHSAGEAPDAAYEWGVPPQAVLDRARALRERLDRQRDGALAAFADKLLLVVGRAKFTPDGYEWGSDGFVYLDASDGGDGRVPLASALLPGVRTWTLDCEHGSLPDERGAFDAFVDLLVSGDTTRLSPLAQSAGTRGAGAAAPLHVRSRPSRARPSAVPADSQRAVFLSPSSGAVLPDVEAAQTALRVSVLNGNLSFVRSALMIGHTRSMSLTGTEAVVDRLIGGSMKASLDAALYPDIPGSHQIFANANADPDNPWRAPEPSRVIVVGLGEEGKLDEPALTRSVRQGTIAWAQQMSTSVPPPQSLQLSATLMGSGGVGMTPSNAARAVAQGVRQANERIRNSGWPQVGALQFVEIFLARATDAWHGLKVLGTAEPEHFDIAPTIESGIGPLRWQVDSGYRGTDYDFIAATSTDADTISFALDTKRARTEVRAQSTQGKLLRELVALSSTDTNQDARLGRTLFQLLVPTEVEPFLAGTSRILLELDARTAPIPWELLDTRPDDSPHADARPWAIRCQVLRKLRQSSYRQQVHDAGAEDAVLVIGEPMVDAAAYGPLPGARAEALAVVAELQGAGGMGAERVTALVDDNDAVSIVNALFERCYRIVHIAGHGEPVHFDAASGRVLSKGGVVLSGGTFLGSDEIRSMRTVPELVFVNCCHLAAHDTTQTLAPALNRPEFAWGVADSLIEIGVRCVIAAGWAVDDRPAEVFAATFYREIMAGRPFISAVAAAREAAWNEDKNSNTWAAYQAYGDPDWRYRSGIADSVAAPVRDEYEGVASPLALVTALEEIAVRCRWMRADAAEQLLNVRQLEGRFAAGWGGIGAVAEAYGVAYAEAGDRDQAITWYERALQCNDASASMKTHEQLGNLRARRGWARAASARGAKAGAELALARDEIQQALQGLQALTALQPTLERLSLCGSAWKRLALVERKAGKSGAEQTALRQAADAYRQAEALAVARQDSALFYPAINRMALELLLSGGKPGWRGFDADQTAVVRRSLLAQADTAPDFWCYAGLIEIDLYEALAGGLLADQFEMLLDRYAELHERVSSPSLWSSVHDQAQFVLAPGRPLDDAAAGRAAQQLLAQLQRFAGAAGDGVAAAPATTPAGPARAKRPARRAAAGAAAAATASRHEVVVWHGPAQAPAAKALAAAFGAMGLSVWLSSQQAGGRDPLPRLRSELETAALGVVLLDSEDDPPAEATVEQWSAFLEGTWRPERPLALATLRAAGAQVPGFLRQATSRALPRRSATAMKTLAGELAALRKPWAKAAGAAERS